MIHFSFLHGRHRQTNIAHNTTAEVIQIIMPPKNTAEPMKEKTKVLVPHKKLHNVPDLLSNRAVESSAAESMTSKLLWMTFLVIMFHILFELFLRMRRGEETIGSGGKLDFRGGSFQVGFHIFRGGFGFARPPLIQLISNKHLFHLYVSKL